jgi:hypothetical protein
VSFGVGQSRTPVEIAAAVGGEARGVAVALRADSGAFYAAGLWASGRQSPSSLLTNSSLAAPGFRQGSPLPALLRYLRLPEIGWLLASGNWLAPPPDGAGWFGLLFASFWGHFGWMSVPFVLGSVWMPILALVCIAGLAGALASFRWSEPRQRRQLAVVFGVCALALAALWVNAHTLPRDQSLQQGRYLFPVLVPLALLLGHSLAALVRRRWRRWWLAGWLGFWCVFAASALARVAGFYGG